MVSDAGLTTALRGLQSKARSGAQGAKNAHPLSFEPGFLRELSEAVLVPVHRQAPVERVDTIEAFLGTCVHETLEARSGGLSPHPTLFQRERE